MGEKGEKEERGEKGEKEERGEEGEKEERRKGEPVGIHPIFRLQELYNLCGTII